MSRPALVLAVGLAAALHAAAPAQSTTLTAAGSTSAATTAAEPLATIELSPYVGKLRTITLRIGDVTGPYLFDTGGGVTCISPEVAGQVGCTPWGHAAGFRLTGEQIAFQWCGDMSLGAGPVPVMVEVSVFDLGALLGDAPPLNGLASVHTFEHQPFTLDVDQGVLILESPLSLARRAAGMARLTARFANQAGGASVDPFVEVHAETGTLWLELDSGNIGRTLLAPHAFEQLGLESTDDQVAELDIAGLGPVPLEIRMIEGCIYDGVLSIELFEGRRITFDAEGGEIWASR